MKTLLLYVAAKHDAKIIKNESIMDTLEKAKENGFERLIIIKKTQLIAKKKQLSFLFDVDEYPKRSISKAISNSNACMIVDGCTQKVFLRSVKKRKRALIDKIIEEATFKKKFVLSMAVPE